MWLGAEGIGFRCQGSWVGLEVVQGFGFEADIAVFRVSNLEFRD